MTTVALSYDQNSKKAQQLLDSLLRSGLFFKADLEDSPAIDYSDPWLYEEDPDLPIPTEGKDTFTLEELREMLLDDLRQIYGVKDEIPVCN